MRASNGIEITVVLPTRDRWNLARAALSQALAQEGVPLEVCVIDDGSLTSAPAGFAADPRVRLFRNQLALGVAAARNRGIREARGEWVAFLDDDDLWAPWHLRRVLGAARAAGAAWAFARFVYTDLERIAGERGPLPSVEIDHERQFLRFNPVGTPSCAIVSTDALRRIGGFDEQLSVMADWDLWVRLAAISRPAVSPGYSVGYTQHEGNMSLDIDRVRAEMDYIVDRHRATLERLGMAFADNHWFWRWIAIRYAGRGRRLMAARFYLRAAVTGGTNRDVFRAIGTIPVLGWPIVARRRLIHEVQRRGPRRLPVQTEFAWLQAPRDGTASSGAAEPSVADISHRWRVRTKPSP